MKRLLIVDDDQYLLDSLKGVFAGAYEISTALSADAAMEILMQEPVDVMLLDFMLPGKDGVTFLRELREKQFDLPVVMISGSTSIRGVMGAMSLGVCDYIRKPFDVDELRFVLQRTLENSELRRCLDEFARPPELKFAPVVIDDMLERALSMARRHDPDGKIGVYIEKQSGLRYIHGDADVLVDSIVHLLLNAFAAVADVSSPRICIQTSTGETGSGRSAVIVEIRDNGVGIPEDFCEKAFSPFYTTKAHGVGLGLPAVRRTVTAHGGSVTIESSEKGTAVRLLLPATETSGGTEA